MLCNILTYIRQRDESNTSTRDEVIQKTGRKATIHVAELSDKESVKGIVPALEGKGHKLDILLNCAGIQRRHPSEKFPLEDWDEVSPSLVFFYYVCLMDPVRIYPAGRHGHPSFRTLQHPGLRRIGEGLFPALQGSHFAKLETNRFSK